jgi:PKD repeat protein
LGNRSGGESMGLGKSKTGMGKKGMFFTISAILIISVLAASYAFYSAVKDREAVQKRVSTMNSYMLSIERDLSRQLYISGFRMIFEMEKEITETGDYLQDLNSSANELFFNGTLGGEEEESMQGATFNDIISTISSNSEKMNVLVDISSPEIEIIQTDPWNVKIILTSDFKMSDKEGLASWDKKEVAEALVSITNFEDPIYALSTNNLVTNNITKTPYETFNLSTFSMHALNSYYKASAKAPSFLDRLEGKMTANENGIESFVNLAKLSAQQLPIEEKSAVDYIYFSSQNPAFSPVSDMPQWFRIDDEHKPDYNLP